METTVHASRAPSRRSQQKEETRERIVASALRLFEKNGFAATRTQDIAVDAGLSHGSIFVHFKTRDELLVHVCERFLSQVDQRTRQAVRGSSSLAEFLHAHVEAIAAQESLYTRLVQEMASLPREVRALHVDTQASVANHLGFLLRREGVALGINPVEHYFLFNAWMGTLTYYLLHREAFTTSERLLKERGAAIVDLFLRLVHASGTGPAQ